MYSIFLRGGGGKGVATGAGVVLALVPLAFLIIFATWIVLMLLTTRTSAWPRWRPRSWFPCCTIAFDKPLPYQIAGVLVADPRVVGASRQHPPLLARRGTRVTLPWDARSRPSAGAAGQGEAERARHRHRLRQLGQRLRPAAVAPRPRRPGPRR